MENLDKVELKIKEYKDCMTQFALFWEAFVKCVIFYIKVGANYITFISFS